MMNLSFLINDKCEYAFYDEIKGFIGKHTDANKYCPVGCIFKSSRLRCVAKTLSFSIS